MSFEDASDGTLPVEPLTALVVRAGSARLAFAYDQGAERAYSRACARGHVTAVQADKLAAALGRHPCEIWSEWTALEVEPPVREVVTRRTCTVAGCERPHRARGYCHGHYVRWSRTGEHGKPSLRRLRLRSLWDSPNVCTVEACGRPHVARGLCGMHYQRVAAGRDVGGPDPVEARRPAVRQGCLVAGCDARHRARGFCATHYKAWWRGEEWFVAHALPPSGNA